MKPEHVQACPHGIDPELGLCATCAPGRRAVVVIEIVSGRSVGEEFAATRAERKARVA